MAWEIGAWELVSTGRDTRASILGWGLVPLLVLPSPNSTIDQGDRQHTAVSYRGISASPRVLTATAYGLTVPIHRRRVPFTDCLAFVRVPEAVVPEGVIGGRPPTVPLIRRRVPFTDCLAFVRVPEAIVPEGVIGGPLLPAVVRRIRCPDPGWISYVRVPDSVASVRVTQVLIEVLRAKPPPFPEIAPSLPTPRLKRHLEGGSPWIRVPDVVVPDAFVAAQHPDPVRRVCRPTGFSILGRVPDVLVPDGVAGLVQRPEPIRIRRTPSSWLAFVQLTEEPVPAQFVDGSALPPTRRPVRVLEGLAVLLRLPDLQSPYISWCGHWADRVPASRARPWLLSAGTQTLQAITPFDVRSFEPILPPRPPWAALRAVVLRTGLAGPVPRTDVSTTAWESRYPDLISARRAVRRPAMPSLALLLPVPDAPPIADHSWAPCCPAQVWGRLRRPALSPSTWLDPEARSEPGLLVSFWTPGWHRLPTAIRRLSVAAVPAVSEPPPQGTIVPFFGLWAPIVPNVLRAARRVSAPPSNGLILDLTAIASGYTCLLLGDEIVRIAGCADETVTHAQAWDEIVRLAHLAEETACSGYGHATEGPRSGLVPLLSPVMIGVWDERRRRPVGLLSSYFA